MRPQRLPLAPTSSLPPLRSLTSLARDDISGALDNLTAIYCPLAFKPDVGTTPTAAKQLPVVVDALVDSGYASEVDDDADDRALAALRADGFERTCAERWLTGFIARAEELECFESDEARQQALDQASSVLESFFAQADEDHQQIEELAEYTREFSFDVTLPGKNSAESSTRPVELRVNDGLAGTNSAEPDDVGLQVWGASIVVSGLLCAEPERFQLTPAALGTAPRIIELGAGTGLVGLTLGKLLPLLGVANATVIATDYHPAVLANLEANIASSFPFVDPAGAQPVQASLLDWASLSFKLPLDRPADMLLATDVVYAPEHATLLRDCASRLLSPQGIFWLVATVRQNGRFEGVSDTVEAAFNAADRPSDGRGRRLTISHAERLQKTQGVGRGDESGYKLFRIVWA